MADYGDCSPAVSGCTIECDFTARHLTCEEDSVTVCVEEALPVTGVVAITGIVDTRELDCLTDSVTICPPASGVFEVDVTNEVDIRDLDCSTDSVTICPPASGVFEVDVTNEVDIRDLTCETDSITVCPSPSGFGVTVDNEVNIRPLTCETDNVTVCIDEPLDVNVTNIITIVPGRRALRGIYYGTIGPLAYATGADAATGGRFWLVNTSGSVIAYIREVRFKTQIQDLALLTALPTVRLERMTFTGTPSGTLVTPAIRDTLDFANTATLRSTGTGMTITAGAPLRSFAPAAADVIGGLLSANASSAVPVEQVFEPQDIDGFPVIRQNQGVVIRQHTAGSGVENRQFWIDIVWEEV